MALVRGTSGSAVPRGSGPSEIHAPSSLSISGVLLLAASSALIVGSEKYPFQGSCFWGRLFASPIGGTEGSIICSRRGVAAVETKSVGREAAERCLRER
jgi:hypothetical protein